ncbi:MAG TPA: RDD family protein [Candidatus Angelobacter sp.]|nr:RDD family protein [Candidatus Angelobacter sp.]
MDKLTIDTPEQVHLEFSLAGIGSRFMATLLDSILQLLLYIAVWAGAALIASAPLGRLSERWVIALVIFAGFVITWGYYAIFESVWKGQTPGKRWAGIRVIKDSGRPITPYEAAARNLVRIIDYLPGFYGVGIVTMLLNDKHRRVGDYVAGTLVVHETSDRESALFFNTPANSQFSIPQASKLTLQEAELIEAFLSRRLDIPPAIRQQNGQRIADMVCTRLGITPDVRPGDNENFLELLVKEFRNRASYR